jgi:hypothetical protein
MYYERLWDLRQSLVRIYTPLHQLYYKLRNVQQAQKLAATHAQIKQANE